MTVKRIRELELENAALDRHIEEMLKEFGATADQLTDCLENPENFSEKNWNEIQRIRKELEEKLDLRLKEVRDPRKSRREFEELSINPQWLFVK